jgi:SH3 domain-containing YSC84-like protein 1
MKSKEFIRMRTTIWVLMLGCVSLYGANKDNTERLEKAAAVFDEVMGISDKAIPQTFLDKSECVVLVPGLKKGAFIVGAKFGRGFISCRNAGGAGWSAPGSVRVEGGSFGFQIGGSETDVIMLVMNERGVERLLRSKFTLGGDASVAAGPVGRDASAQTDAMMTAEILTWSRSRGVFAGVSLQGATLRQDIDVNTDLYGKAYENAQIVKSGLGVPDAAKKMISLLSKYSARKSK